MINRLMKFCLLVVLGGLLLGGMIFLAIVDFVSFVFGMFVLVLDKEIV